MMPFDFDPNRFRRFSARVTDNAERTSKDVAHEAAEAFVDAVLETMNTVFENAVTPTGQRRAERRGGHPGRIDTGDMVANLNQQIEDLGNVVLARAGWTRVQEAYYLLQDQGTSNIQAAHALEQGFQAGIRAAREVLNRRWGR